MAQSTTVAMCIECHATIDTKAASKAFHAGLSYHCTCGRELVKAR